MKRVAIVTELDIDTGKRRCAPRSPFRTTATFEPEDPKGRTDASTPKNGVIKC